MGRHVECSIAFVAIVIVSGCATPVAPPRVLWPAGDSSSARYSGVLPTVDAKVSAASGLSSKARLVLDTGCEGVALSSSVVEALDLPSLHRLVRYDGSPVEKGGIGQGRSVSYGLGKVEVAGGFELSGGEAMGVEMPAGIDALAGLVAFPRRAIVFDPSVNEVHFVSRELADQLADVDGAIQLPAQRKHNTLRVAVSVAGIEAEFLVDTGARYSWISPSVARDAASGGFVQGRVFSGHADLGLRVLRVESDGPLQGSLGSDILLGLGRAILLDLDRERVVLMPPIPASSR